MVFARQESPRPLILKGSISMFIYKLKQHPSFYKSLPHTMGDRTPYTYLIGWSAHNIWYYGSRTANGCHPSELFDFALRKNKKYETSSKYVKNFIMLHGIPDIIQIRQIFHDTYKCCKSESKVLRRINVKDSIKFLNKCNGYDNGHLILKVQSDEHKNNIRKTHTGKIVSNITRKRLSEFKQNKVNALNIITNEKYLVSNDEFVNNPNLVGQTYSLSPCKDDSGNIQLISKNDKQFISGKFKGINAKDYILTDPAGNKYDTKTLRIGELFKSLGFQPRTTFPQLKINESHKFIRIYTYKKLNNWIITRVA